MGKAFLYGAGGGGSGAVIKEYDGSATIEGDPITGLIIPEGTLNIDANGSHDVTEYASVEVDVVPTLQEKTVTENGDVTFDEGYDGLSKVIVAVPIPDGYIVPEGCLEITANGAYDVSGYESAEVNVTGGGGEDEDLEEVLTEQEELIENLKEALENKIAVSKTDIIPLTVTENGTYTAPEGQAYSPVEVNVAGSGGEIVFPDDGKTRLLISVKDIARMPIPLFLLANSDDTVTIDWGDGTTDSMSGGYIAPKHEYSNVGDYVITVSTGQNFLQLGHGGSMSVVGGTNYLYRNTLKKVHLGHDNRSVVAGAFLYCSSLESISMDNSVTQIASDTAFDYCRSIKEVKFSDAITTFPESLLRDLYTLENVVLPSALQSIPNSTFYACDCLSTIELPDTITSIGQYAFSSCRALVRLVLPASLTSISDYAFNYCENVKTYDFSKCTSVPTLGATRVFYQIPSDCEILVPSALYDEWIAATNWVSYASKIKAV